MRFFIGIPEPAWAGNFERAFISVARLRRRKAVFSAPAQEWAMDSAAFSEVALHGGYRHPPEVFAREAAYWTGRVPGCAFVASQDFMCEPFVLAKTGLTVEDHQRLTIERFDALKAAWSAPAPLLPVLQGFTLETYVRHLGAYGDRIPQGAWVGVGSVCKRQGDIRLVEDILVALKRERPDLRLHGFGVKLTALRSPVVRDLLHSADSMAWAYAARRQGRNPNDRREAQAYVQRVLEPLGRPYQPRLSTWMGP